MSKENGFQGRISPEMDGWKLERVLLALMEGASRSEVTRLVKRGAVRLDGQRVRRTNAQVRAGEGIRVGVLDKGGERDFGGRGEADARGAGYGRGEAGPGRERSGSRGDRGRGGSGSGWGSDSGRKAPVGLDVVFEDEHIALVNKPPGLLCHGMAERRPLDLEDHSLGRGRGAGGLAARRKAERGGGVGGAAGRAGGLANEAGRSDAPWGRGGGRGDERSHGQGERGGRHADGRGGASGRSDGDSRDVADDRWSDGRGERGSGAAGGMRGQDRDDEWRGERPAEVTLSDLAVERFGRLPLLMGDERPGIVHRLDRETSGIIMVTRTGDAMEAMREAFRERRVEKAYLALVHGDPDWDQLELDWDLTDGADDRRGWREAGSGDQDARTGVEVVERYGPAALVLCHPLTGRRHQIRVHLFAAGHGIVGDKLYADRDGPRLPRDAPGVRRHLLHAAGLAFEHPITGEPFEAEAPMADDMAAVVDWLEG